MTRVASRRLLARGAPPLLVGLLALAFVGAFEAPWASGMPTNDAFTSAFEIGSTPYSNPQSTHDATTEGGEPGLTCSGGGATVWYKHTPTSGGMLGADTSGSNYDTVLMVYSGTSFAALEDLAPVGCNDDVDGLPQSRTIFAADPGVTYYFQVLGSESATGDLAFNLSIAPPPPANDALSAALQVSEPLPYSDSQSVAAATLEAGESDIGGCAPRDSTVWYSYTPAVSGSVSADILSSEMDTVLGVYSGPASGATLADLVDIDCSTGVLGEGPAESTFIADAGTTYYFQIGGMEGQTGDLVFNLNSAGPPGNDPLAAAAAIADPLPFSASQTTLEATFEPGEPAPSCAATGASVWFQYTPSTASQLLADTFGSDFNTALAVYSGPPAASHAQLTPVACNDDLVGEQSRLTFSAAAGTTYYFQVAGVADATGGLSFQIEASPTLVSDALAAAVPAPDPTPDTPAFDHTQSTAGATMEPGEPVASCASSGATVWYSYTPPADAALTANTFDSDFDAVLAVYAGPAGANFASLTPVACVSPVVDVESETVESEVTFSATGGTTYYFQASGLDGQTGVLAFNLRGALAPENDALAAATASADPLPLDTSESTEGATLELGEPAPPCGAAGATVWYKHTAVAAELLTATTLDSEFDTVLAVYSGPDGATPVDLVPVACNDDSNGEQSRVYFTPTPGTTYYVQVGGADAAMGSMSFTLCTDVDSDALCPASDNCPDVANAEQLDFDEDLIGDVCDPDNDNDGALNNADPDDDNDRVGDAEEAACGGATPSSLRPERVDGEFATIDDDGDSMIDEALPSGAGGFDCDGDGFNGMAENHVFSYLPGGPTDGDQKACQDYDAGHPNPSHKPSKRWPADLSSSTFSFNKVNIQDVAAYISPIRYLNQDTGTDPGDVRFDLVPSSTFGTDINVADLAAITSGVSGFPAMLGGARAFNGPACPYAP
jgi:hypothetical protein